MADKTVKVVIQSVSKGGGIKKTEDDIKKLGKTAKKTNQEIAKSSGESAKVSANNFIEQFKQIKEEYRSTLAEMTNSAKSNHQKQTKSTEKVTKANQSTAVTLGSGARAASILSATLAAGAVVAVGSVAVYSQLTRKVFGLSQEFASMGKQLDIAQQKTNLKTASLSGLRVESERLGIGFRTVVDSVEQFEKNMGLAAGGSLEFKDKMRSLGIEPIEGLNNLDGALKSVFEKIANTPKGVQQAKLAVDAFGSGGQALIPIINSTGGSMDSLISKARELGLVMSQEDVEASKEFTSEMTELQNRMKGIALTFGKEAMPIFTEFFDNLNGFLRENGGYIKSWASTFATSLRNTIRWGRTAIALFKTIRDINPFAKASEAITTKHFDKLSESFNRSDIRNSDLAKALTSGIGTLETNKLNFVDKDNEDSIKANTKNLKSHYDLQLAYAKQSFQIQSALLGLNLQENNFQRFQAIKATEKLKTSSLQKELAIQKAFFGKQQALFANDSSKLLDIRRKRLKTVSDIETKVRIAQIGSQKQLAQLNSQIQRQRLSDLQRFSGLQLDSYVSFFDDARSETQRFLDTGQVDLRTGFDSLLGITEDKFSAITQQIRYQFDLQLQDANLSSQQRINLELEKSNAIKKITSDRGNELLRIEDTFRQRQARELEKKQKYFIQQNRLSNSLFSSAGEMFNPQSFNRSSLNNIQNRLLKSSEISELKAQIEGSKKAVDDINLAISNFDSTVKKVRGVPLYTIAEGEQKTKLENTFEIATNKVVELNKSLKTTKDSVRGVFLEVSKLGQEIQAGDLSAFDKVAKTLLNARQQLDRAGLESEVDLVKQLIQLENLKTGDDKDQGRIKELNFRLSSLQIYKKQQLAIDQSIESTDLYNESLEGLGKTLKAIQNGEVQGLTYLANKRILQEQIGNEVQKVYLLEKLKNFEAFANQEIELSNLNDVLNLRNKETDAIKRRNSALFELRIREHFHQFKQMPKF